MTISLIKLEPDWPIMEPGDGIDNDQDGDVDEDECCKYKCLLNTCTFMIYMYLYGILEQVW